MAMETARTGDLALLTITALSARGAATIAEVADELDVSRTSAQRILTTLHRAGLVRRANDHRFELGPAMLRMSEGVVKTFARRARGVLREVSRKLEVCAIILSVRDGDEVLVVQQATGNHAMAIEYIGGFRMPLSMGAHGEVILAHMSESDWARIEPSSDPERMREILDQGYAVTRGAVRTGMVGIAAPISNSTVGVFASISAAAPESYAPPKDLVIATLNDAAARLTVLAEQQQGGDVPDGE